MILHHDASKDFYRSPSGALPTGSQVLLRLCIEGEGEKVPERVELRVWDGDERRYPMRPLGIREDMQYYEVQISFGLKPCLYWYRFEVFDEGQRYVLGAGDPSCCGKGAMGSEDSFQITVYDSDYDAPAWMREGIMYQIMVDRFYHGEGTDALMHAKDGENISLHDDWYGMPELNVSENGDNFANDFFGGNLEGVRQKLPYLKDLGVSIIYFNPIFKARSNHKYDTDDYMVIDPMFGDEAAFTRLCEDAKAMGIRIIIDGVFSHVGDTSIYFNRRGTHGEKTGAYRDPDSPYAKWFTFRSWPDDYECWWGFRTLPNVNEMDDDYRAYILGNDDAVVKHWLRAGASGWRLDVADELPMEFLRQLRKEVKSTNPDAAVLGEGWEDASHKVAYGNMRSYVLGDTLDSVMNYPLRENLIEFLLGRRNAFAAAAQLEALAENYPKPFYYSLMNLMGSHDRARIINVLADNDGSDISREERMFHQLNTDERMVGSLRERLMLRFTMSVPGMPCIYYADEAGLEGCADPFCRRTYPWGKEDQEMLAFYKKMTAMRNAHPVLRTGECRYIAPCEDVLGVVRTFKGGADAFGKPAHDACAVTLINRSAHPIDVYLMAEDVMHATELIDLENHEMYARSGAFSIHLEGMRGITCFAAEFDGEPVDEIE